jgi:hypothetical protein
VIVQQWDNDHRLVAQLRRVVKSTIRLGLVSAYLILILSTYITYPARLLSFFGKPGLEGVIGASIAQLLRMFSMLEVPTLPWAEACKAREGQDRI